MSAFLLLTIVLQVVINKFKMRKLKYVFAVSAFFLFLFFGMFNSAFHKAEKPNIELYSGNVVLAQVNSPLEERAKTFKTKLEIIDTIGKNFEVIAYFAKDSIVSMPSFGDLIAFKADFMPVERQGNPMEFDYAGYLEKQNIFFTTYIKSNCFTIVKPNFSSGIKHFATSVRERLLNYYREKNIEGQEFAVLAALTLGYKGELDDSTRNAFQASGAMHVLAVSGLHVGIILLITNFLLGFLGASFISKLIRFFVVEITIWFFAAITGFSPSVCRAALMFSFVALGQLLNRNSDIYSTLASSAFILLVINPSTLFNVGFALSYSAVFGIVAIMPMFENLYNPENKIFKYFYQLLAVSVAAQIATSVLSICCFNRFPNYFLLTAPVVIPLAYVIMLLAIAMIFTNFLPFVSDFLADFLKLCVKFLNSSVGFVEKLPGSVTENIFIDTKTAILLYGIVISCIIIYHYRDSLWLKTSLILFILACFLRFLETPERHSDGLVAVYNRRGSSIIQISSSSNTIILTDVDSSDRDKYFYELFLRPCALTGCGDCNIYDLENVGYKFSDNVFNVGEKSIAVITDKTNVEKMIVPYHFDFLIVTTKKYLKVENLIEKLSPEKIIFTSGFGKKQSKIAQQLCDSLNVDCHFAGLDGAFLYGRGNKIVWKY